jgi:hypothetical protein
MPTGARLVVQHVFRSEEDKPLEAIYAFPLPRDAALRSFRITDEGFDTGCWPRSPKISAAARRRTPSLRLQPGGST